MIYIDSYYLKPLEEKDLNWVQSIRNDKKTWPFLGTFSLINESRQKKWFEKLNQEKDTEYLTFGKNDKKLGVVRLTNIDHINRSVCVGGDIDPQERGQGYSLMMYKLIFKLGFDTWGMHRLWLLVMDNNEVALHLYKKMGFVEEGREREAIFRSGKFHDYIMMSILEHEYKRLYKK